MKINSNNILKFSTFILITGVIFAIVAPFIFTRDFGGISFKETGPIGDTIGGITAPIVNLIGAVLVFFALHAQIEANKIIQNQIDSQKSDAIKSKNFDNLLRIYAELKKDIESFTYTRNEATGSTREMLTGGIQPVYITYQGNEAINKAYNEIKRDFCNSYNNKTIVYSESTSHKTFLASLKILHTLLSKTFKDQLFTEDKDTMIALLQYVFETKLKPSLSEDSICIQCKKHNALPEDLHELVSKIQSLFYQINIVN